MDPITEKIVCYEHSLSEECMLLFTKKFSFQQPLTEKWQIPKLSANKIEKYTVFPKEKERLNRVKNKLNEMPIEKWSVHTRDMNPASKVIKTVKFKTKVEFPTQAWCKLYECLCSYPVIQENSKALISLHLCEAPGAFVASLNHYLQANRTAIEWKWIATTLNPYYEGNSLSNMIIDDRFIIETLPNWDFGADYTGDIINLDNFEYLKQKCVNMGKVDFVTADGSIDCLLSPESQEERVATLHLSETMLALEVLKPGGSFILKMFTFFECSSLDLLYLLNCNFCQVDIFKPATSKEGNSEVYVICQEYKPSIMLQDYIKSVKGTNFDTQFGLFEYSKIPKSFIEQVNKCIDFFMHLQINVIERNLYTFMKDYKTQRSFLTKLKFKICEEFYRRYNIKSIVDDARILPKNYTSKTENLNPKLEKGSYTEMKSQNNLTALDKYLLLENQLRELLMTDSHQGKINLSLDAKQKPILNIIFGKPIKTLLSSKFIYYPNLKLFLEIMELTEYKFTALNNEAIGLTVTNENKDYELDIDFLYYCQCSSYNEYEKSIAHKICQILKEMPDNGSLTIHRLLMLSQFLNGFVYYLAQILFEEITFYKDGKIVLNKFDKNNYEASEILSSLNLNHYSHKSSDVIGLIQLQTLLNTKFYKTVINYNTSLVLHYAFKYMSLYP